MMLSPQLVLSLHLCILTLEVSTFCNCFGGHHNTLALAFRPILLTIHKEARTLTPLLIISRQNTHIQEQDGGFDEQTWQHVTDPCGYHPPVSAYIALCRPPRYPIDRHAAGRGHAHAPLHRLAHYDWDHHSRRGHRFA